MGIFDCDTHCYETRDAFTKYMPKELLERSIFPVRLPDGSETDPRRPARRGVQQRAGTGLRPGVPPGFAEGDAQADGVGESRRDLRADADAARVPGTAGPDAAARAPGCRPLRALPVDDGAVGRAVRPRHTVAYANIHSFNRWFDETWDFDGERISPTALLSFRDLDRSVAELEHVLDRGARVVLFPTGPANGRSPGDPYFDPLWARIDEAGAVVAFHIMEHWYNEHIAPAWGLEPVPAPVAHVGVAVAEHLRRTADRGLALGARSSTTCSAGSRASWCWRRSSAPRGCRTS